MWAKIVIILLILISTEKISAELSFIYPSPTDSLECGTTININWINTTSNPIDLYYSLDSLNWILIENNLNSNNYNWLVPFSLKPTIYFKLSRASNSEVELIWDKQRAHTDWNQVSKFVGSNKLVTVGKEDSVKVWEISTKKLLRTLFIQNSSTNIQATNFAMEYDKDKLLVAQDKAIWTWDLSTDSTDKIYVNTNLGTARVLDYDPNNREVAIGSNKGFVEIIDLFGVKIAQFDLPNTKLPNIKTIYSLDYSSDGKFLAVAGDDGYVYIINLETEEILQSKSHHGDTQNLTIWSVEISNDNKYILTGGVDNQAFLWDFSTLDTIISYPKTANIRSARFNKNSQSFLIAGLNNGVDQYSISSLNTDGNTINHGSQILWAEYLNNGDTLVSAGRDGSFKIWRNSRTDPDITIGTSNLYQKMEINFPELQVYLNQKFEIPIEFKGNFDLLDSVIINYFLPIDLAHILDGLNPVMIITRDEEYSKKFEKGDIQTQVINLATALMSDRRKGDIKFVDIKYYPTGNYRVNTDDGFIEIIDTCGTDTSRFVFIEKETTKVEITKMLVDDLLNYELSTIIDAEYDISIYGIYGNKILQLQNTFFRNGKYLFSDNIENLSGGVYFLVTKFEDKLLSKKFIKLEK